MKQFEFAIQKIASEVQSLDRRATARTISQLEQTIDALHGKLAQVDRLIAEWARKNLERVRIDGADIDPQDAAREIVEGGGQYEWIPDRIDISPQFEPQISDEDIVRLRQARRSLGADIGYLGHSLPQLVEFPESKLLLQVHQDLAQYTTLTKAIESGEIPSLADSSQETLDAAQWLVDHIEELVAVRREISESRKSWTVVVHGYLRSGASADLIALLEAIGSDLEDALKEHRTFLQRPVATPANLEVDIELVEAVSNRAQGKSPFGVFGLFGKSEQKKLLEQITVLGTHPTTAHDWKHVHLYLANQKRFRELAVRWNSLAPELRLDLLSGVEPQDGITAAKLFEIYTRVKSAVEWERLLLESTAKIFVSWERATQVADSHEALAELDRALRHHLAKNRLADVWGVKERFQRVLEGRSGPVIGKIRDFLVDTLGNPQVPDAEMQGLWSSLMSELSRVLGLGPRLHDVAEICDRIQMSGAPQLAHALKQPLQNATDPLCPDNWRQAWRLRRLATYLETIDAQEELKTLAKTRTSIENDLSRTYQDIVVKRTWLKLAENASPSIRAALQAYLNAIQKIGKGTGKRAVRYRQDARNAAQLANPAVPCWIMAHYRVSESLPAELGCFDLVVVDEASQSDLTALPALLRAKKVLIVGDDKQVSPEGVGLEEEKVRNLMSRFLGNQVVTYRPQMSPERSIYDLFKVVFAQSAVMLKEHFRCVGPIIEYSKREFYNHELRPLRIPRASERIDPPLVDIVIENGYRRGDINLLEVRFIVDEITKLVSDTRLANRSIGVVSLLGDKQAYAVWERLTEELGPEEMQRHNIACGDARTFQGKERHIMFLSMVSAPNDVGAPLSRDTFAQRFNVAASRAQDRMYLVRSVELAHLSNADRLRRSLIHHFASPFAQDETRVEDLRKLCESPFEREVYDELTQRGFNITPQVRVGHYRIDLVVEGHNDSRLAVECDGDKYHGADKWADDMRRQRILERAGWVFWRCFASTWIRRRKLILDELLKTLEDRGIGPIGAEGAPRSVHTEQRRVLINQ
jgi:very-short-patch-repair endonuclease